MKHHELDLAEFLKFLEEEPEVLYASSSRENKRLICKLKGNFEVRVGGEVVWSGMQPYSAVEAYNNITKKWIYPLKDFKI